MRDFFNAKLQKSPGAESYPDFTHKLAIVLEELNETSIWLRIIRKGQLLKAELLVGIITENVELCRIITSSIKTARAAKGNDK